MFRRTYLHNGEPINCAFGSIQPSQNLSEILVENSCLFLFSKKSFYGAGRSRIGLKPQLFHMHECESADIDWEYDFVLAELMQKNSKMFAGFR
jgi:CMP-N-acetylneuraminic acid synthetase